jgi:hypothetical protein
MTHRHADTRPVPLETLSGAMEQDEQPVTNTDTGHSTARPDQASTAPAPLPVPDELAFKPDWMDFLHGYEAGLAAAALPQDEREAALKAIVEFCDDPHGSDKGESLAVGLARLLPAARAALSVASPAAPEFDPSLGTLSGSREEPKPAAAPAAAAVQPERPVTAQEHQWLTSALKRSGKIDHSPAAAVQSDAERDAARYRALRKFLSIEDVGDEDYLYALVVDGDALELAAMRAKIWQRRDDANVDEAVDALAAMGTAGKEQPQ